MIGTDVKISANGDVTGTLKTVTGFTKFSNAEQEQSGHYFPITLTGHGDNMTLKKNGSPQKEGIPFDADIIFRVENTEETREVEIDGKTALTLNFRNARFE